MSDTDAALTRIAGDLPPRPVLHVYRCPSCRSTDTAPGAIDWTVTCRNCEHRFECPACDRPEHADAHPVSFADQVLLEARVQGLTLPAELAGTVS